jgi:hypothetical protein
MTMLSIGACMNSPPTLHEKYFGVCRCKCTFVDIGLNDGSSLMRWWRDPALDRLSQDQSRNLHECRARHRESCYYGFEANPRWSTQLMSYEQRLSRDHRVKLFVGTALSVGTTNRTLYVEKEGAGVDASLESSKTEHYKDAKGRWHRNSEVDISGSKAFVPKTVLTMDATSFLAQMVDASDFVFVKLDIEGHEYEVLRHVIVTRPAAVCGLDILAVEWHGTGMSPASGLPVNATETFKWLLKQRKECTVALVQWH